MALESAKSYASDTQIIGETVDLHREGLKELNYYIHSNPELCYEEFKAHDACVAYLTKLGFKVTPHAYGIPTAFEADYTQGHGGRVVVCNAEYDALPGIGHACGHNLICVASFAGFLSAVAQLKASGIPGSVRVLGTPAEEGGSGKAGLIKNGAYEGVDACLIAHPAPLYLGYSEPFQGTIYVPHNASDAFQIRFRGQNAHAAANPWDGRNALDAVVMAYTAIGLLRQQTHGDCRMHGVIANGGLKQNIIPDYTLLDYSVRAPSLGRLRALKQRIVDCCEAAAKATACTVQFTDTFLYTDVRPNKTLCSVISEECDKLNYPLQCDFNFPRNPASTDQGNVSYVVPSLQYIYGIPANAGCFNHTIGFHDASGTQEAFDRTLIIAKVMGATVWKVLSDDKVASKMKQEFDADRADREAQGITEGEVEAVTRWSEEMMEAIKKANKNDGPGKCTCHGKE